MLPAVRKNVRKALNKRFGVRKWTKHSRAKWNPGVALSLGGVKQSITSVFRLENVYDGLAIGGGIVGALALPGVVQKLIPTTIAARLPFSLTTGWMSYVANALSAGVLGYGVSVAFGRRYGEKVFLGGIGATMAKLLLDKVPLFKNWTGVTLQGLGDYNLQRVIEEEVARELRSGMTGLGAYATPGQVSSAYSLGDYASPSDVFSATALGNADEFGESEDFESA